MTLRSKRKKALAGLTDRQRQFVVEYLVSLNATDAATKAGYAHPNQAAAKLMKDTNVIAAIERERRETIAELRVTREEVLRQLYFCLSRNAKQLFDEKGILVLSHKVVRGKVVGTTIHDLPDSLTNTIDGIKQKVKRYQDSDGNEYEDVETELKLVSKGSAIDMGMKHVGAYEPEKVDLTVRGEVPWEEFYGEPEAPKNVIELKRIDHRTDEQKDRKEPEVDATYTVEELTEEGEER